MKIIEKINMYLIMKPIMSRCILIMFIFISIKLISYTIITEAVVNSTPEPLISSKPDKELEDTKALPVNNNVPSVNVQVIIPEISKENIQNKETFKDHAITVAKVILFISGAYALYKISQSLLTKLKSISYTSDTSDTNSTSSETSNDSYKSSSEYSDGSLSNDVFDIPEYLSLSLIKEMLLIYKDVAPLFPATCFPLIELKLAYISTFIFSNLPSDIDPQECIKQMQVIVDQAIRDGDLPDTIKGCFDDFKISWFSYYIIRNKNLLIILENQKDICDIYDQVTRIILEN